MIPPSTIAPASHLRSPLRRGVSVRVLRTRRYTPKPVPDPKYNKPASNCGETEASNDFASGALAPKSAADASAR